MHRYWDDILEPVLTLLGPNNMVEIGCKSDRTTHLLLEFCRQRGAVLHGIDPAPQIDVALWQQEFGGLLRFHGALSLEALPNIHDVDAVLIDGDLNWYTVVHELKLIERTALRASRPFPLVFVHGVEWPYGRRDRYVNPETIPLDYRHPYAKQGLRPGSSDLVADGINADAYQAVTENTPYNGVLTAVEDHLRETNFALRFIVVPGFHGLGILYPGDLAERNAPLDELLSQRHKTGDGPLFLGGQSPLSPASQRKQARLEAAGVNSSERPTNRK